MQRQASSNISSHSWGLSIRTVTLKVILRFAPPPPPLRRRRCRRRSTRRRHARRGRRRRRTPPSSPATTAAADRRAVDRLAFLEEEGAAVLGEPQVGHAAAEAAAHAARGDRRPSPTVGRGVPVAIRVIRLPLSWIV